MLDFHSHILPGLDDGAADLDTAIQMARIAVEDGITTMVATPHYIEGSMENSRNLILERVEQFQQELNSKQVPLKIIPGCEVYLSPNTPDLLRQARIMTINDRGKCLLVELPMQTIPSYLDDVLFEIKLQGVTPVIAHPERNIDLGAKPEKVLELVQKGCLLQLNAGSFSGLYGKKAKRAAELLAINGFIHLLGSDVHSAGGRSPGIRKALSQIEKLKCEKVKEIAANGEKVLVGDEINPLVPVRVERFNNTWLKIKHLFG